MKFPKEEIDEILNALELSNFNELYDEMFFYQVVQPFKDKYKKPFNYDYGASKGVLIFKNLGFVIKIPFKISNDYGEMFYGADCDNGWDYCEAEYNKYKIAQSNHLEQCFAETKLIDIINDYPIYIQEYVEMYLNVGEEKSSNTTKEDVDTVRELCEKNDYNCFNLTWLSDAFTFFGEKVFYQLLNFISDAEINDLHNGNIGYIGMRPVLVDYSSYND